MHKTLRTRLVGIGLVVALLALAVPALAQNQWSKQTTPASFPTPVQALGVNGAGLVSAATAGGGYPGGNLGYPYYSTDHGATYTQYAMTPCPPFAGPGDDFTAILWDGTYGYTGTWNSGLYVYDGVNPPTNPTCGDPSINQHVQALAFDALSATGTLPHDLYFATWGGGVWKYNGTAFTHVFDPFTMLVNGAPATPAMYFAWDIAFKQGTGAANPRMMFIATDGGGLIKGVQNWTSGVWTWTVAFNTDPYVYSVEYDYATNSLFVGTQSNGIYASFDLGATWSQLTSPISTPVNDILFVGYPNFVFAATGGQGVYRFDSDLGAFNAMNNGSGVFDLTDLNVNALAYDGPNHILYAGTTGASATGNVWRVTLDPFIGTFTSTSPIEVGTAVNDCVTVVTLNNAPPNWTAAITAGSLPPGLSPGVNHSTYPPAVCITGAPTADGCYIATLSVWDALWNRTDFAVAYTVNPGVFIDANPNPAQYGQVIAFTSTVTGATGTVSYDWDFGDLTPHSTLANPTHLYAGAGSYTVTLVVTDTNAAGPCTVTTTQTLVVDVYGNLTVDPEATIVGSGAQFQFDPNVSGGQPNCATPSGFTFNWVFTDAQTGATITTSTLELPVITFPYTGTFKGQVTVTDCSGHTATGFTVVNYNGFMAATVASSCNPGPTNQVISFTITAHSISPAAAPPYTVDFDFDGDGTYDVTVPTMTDPSGFEVANQGWIYTAPGSYLVRVRIFDGGSSTTIVDYPITIYPQFTNITVAASPNPASGCDLHIGETITFTVTPHGGIAPFLYSVDFGDGTTASNSTGVFTHAYAAGTYTATFYATDSGNCAVTNTATYGPFNVVAEPTLAINVNGLNCNQGDAFGVQIPNFGVNPLAVALNATYTATAGHTVTYAWTTNNNFAGDDPDTFSGSVVAPAPIPVYNENFYLSAGDSYRTFTATLTITDTGFCVNDTVVTKTIKFTIYKPLAVAAPSWQQACGSRTVTFNASASVSGGIPGYTYVWNFGDGSSAGPFTTPGPVTHTYAVSGEYDAQLTVVDSALPNCTTTHNTANVIFHLSVVDPFTGTASASPTVGCAPLTVNFTSSVHGGGQPGDNFQLRWTASDGWDTGWGASATPSHTFTTPGTYTWTLQARSNVYNPYVCTIATGTVRVDSAASNLVIVPTSTSDYIPLDDTFTTTWNGGSAPITLTYTLTRIKDKDGNFLPVPEVVTQTVTNATSPYQFTYTFEKTGTWTVVCDLSDTCTASLASNTVTVQVLDTPALTVTTQTLINGVVGTSGLAPLTVNFSSVPQGGVPPYTFAWNFGDSTSSTAQNPIHTYTAPGVYNVTLTVTDSYPAAAGGPQHASAAVTITVYNPLTVTATAAPTTILTGATVNFNTTVTGGTGTYSYAWNFGDGGVGTGPAPAHQYLTPGVYFARVRVTDTATNFADSNDIVIRVYSPVTASASASPNPVIIGNSVAFTALASGGSGTYTYSWNFGDSTVGSGATINHTYTSLGTKNVVLTVTDTQLSTNVATVNLTVVVRPVPPQILASKKLTDPFRIVLFGTNFQPGCTVTVNGTGVTVNFVNSGKIKLLNAKSLCPKGVPVPIVVTNPDGGVSNTYMFTR